MPKKQGQSAQYANAMLFQTKPLRKSSFSAVHLVRQRLPAWHALQAEADGLLHDGAATKSYNLKTKNTGNASPLKEDTDYKKGIRARTK